ncbi:OLC1v1007667C1 [Oldenlandia corymbosa var. corymbosa]|uniref:Receptor-like serine/threonine-protein kinase n=1 Tax=Oldenlandia corymbosa var. corymbosa TaxID=529605 RepID=A0AAV1DKB4_OLDCO|nr:OLC1v1007667C1 [Oldenlandia corymbosa var. corymbosa]
MMDPNRRLNWLDLDGRLVLVQNQNGEKIVLWSSNTSGLGINKASLLDNGNLVLLDSKDKVLWESFSSPTNILLPGQSFHYPQNLRALSAKSTLSYYSLVISKSGELQLVWEHNVTYWRSPISPSVLVKEARFDNDGVLGLYDEYNKVAWSVSSQDLGDLSSTKTLQHLSLDQDGNLRIYSWHNVTREWKAGWQAVQEQCNVFGSCGLYSLCGYNSTGPVCWCLYSLSLENWDTAFSPIAADFGGGSGCRKMVDLANCRMRTSMVVMKQTVLYGIYPPIDVEMFLSEKDCREYCANDSTCIAVTSMNDGSGKCTVKRTSFISGYNTHSVAATSFLKACSVPQAVAAQMNSHNSAGLIDSSISGRKKASQANTRALIGAIALIAFITVVVVVSLELFVIWIAHGSGQIKPQTRIPFGKDARMNPHYSALIRLNFEEIKGLTDNFATPLGPSYFKGTLPNKTLVVAKLLNDITVSEKDFRFAVSTLGGTHHRNLASIKGFCFEPKHKILLYEYIPNGSLDHWLLGPEVDESKRVWQERLQIAVGVARAIAYLHTECQQCIIHGNLKLENVLLDENLVPKLTDFGLRSLLFKERVASSSTEMPSEKDIYMLGMLLLQIVTCKRDVDGISPHKMLDELFDQKERFADSDEFKSVERVMKIAIWCMQDQPFLRPSISEVVKVLEGTLSVDRPPSGFMLSRSIAVERLEGEES